MKLCIYCAGGFGKEVYDIALRVNEAEARWDEIFFTDDTINNGCTSYIGNVYSFEYILGNLDCQNIEFVIANGEPAVSKVLYLKMKSFGFKLTNIIDPSSIISKTAHFKEGVIIAPLCSISSSVDIGNNVAINTHSIIGHDISIGDNTVVSSFVNIGGACNVGTSSYIGMGVQVKEKLSIGSESIVGMGSVVFNNVPDQVIALGNPARPMRRNEEHRVFKK